MSAIINVLDRVEKIAKQTPPVDNSASRFGNPAFKTFYDKVQEVRLPLSLLHPIQLIDQHVSMCGIGCPIASRIDTQSPEGGYPGGVGLLH